MQDALLDGCPVGAPAVDFSAHSFPLQPYHHSPVPHSLTGTANASILTASTYPLTSHEHHHLLKLESVGYTELQPRTREGSDVNKDGRQCPEGEDEEEIVPEAEYVNPRCVIFTFYSGDVNTVVDEHFKRALSQPSSFSREGVCRNKSDIQSKATDDKQSDSNRETSNSPVQSTAKEKPAQKGAKTRERGGTERFNKGWKLRSTPFLLPVPMTPCGDDTTKHVKNRDVEWFRHTALKTSNAEFHRELKQEDDVSSPTLMCRRKFPPSFWNSNYWREMKAPGPVVQFDGTNVHYLSGNGSNCFYQNAFNANTAAAAVTPFGHSDTLFTADTYTTYRHRATGIQGQSDPWHYAISAAAHHQSAFAHHKSGLGIHELSYGLTSGSAFNPRYSSLLIQPTVRSAMLPAVPGQMELPKTAGITDHWTTPGYNGLHSHPQHYPTDMTPYGIDSTTSLETHETPKDLFWF